MKDLIKKCISVTAQHFSSLRCVLTELRILPKETQGGTFCLPGINGKEMVSAVSSEVVFNFVGF